MTIADILSEITYGKDPITTVAEIAVVCSRDPQTVYGYRRGEHVPDFNFVRALNRWLIEEKGCYLIINQMFPCVGGRANGKVDEDLLSIWEAGTDIHRAFKSGDQSAYLSALGQLKSEIKDLEAEGKTKWGK